MFLFCLIMSYVFDPMTLRQMLLWLKPLSHDDVYKINSITQECTSLMSNYCIAKELKKDEQTQSQSKKPTKQKKIL